MPRRKDRKQISLTVTESFYKAVQKAAEAEGLPVSEYVRSTLSHDMISNGIGWEIDPDFYHGKVKNVLNSIDRSKWNVNDLSIE